MIPLFNLFERMIDASASDLHLSEGSPPILRVHGDLMSVPGQAPLDRGTMTSYMESICPDERWQHFTHAGDLDFAFHFESADVRLRVNYFLKEVGLGAVFRRIPTQIASLDDIAAPGVLTRLADLDRGLVLVTGPTGSGKSTTLAAMLDHINTTFSKRIVTIEEPIEFLHPRKRSVIVQREVGEDAPSFHEALHSSARMDFDVILVGEMRDFETIAAALSAAELGVLVFGTLHTNSAAKAVDRIIDVFPASQQPQIRGQLAENLKGVCAQTLLKNATGDGRVAAHEILVQTPALQTSIRERKPQGILSCIQSGRSLGMQLMDDAIDTLLQDGRITRDEAHTHARDKRRFAPRLAS